MQQQQRLLMQLSAAVQEFPVLFLFLQTRRSLPFSVLYTSIRTAVSSSNSELIRDLSMFSVLLQRLQRLFRVLSFPQALIS